VLLMYADPAHTQAMTAGDRDMMARNMPRCGLNWPAPANFLDGAGPAYRADTTTLRLDGGAVATSHGPLITSTVELTAYYLVRCPDMDRALALAAHILDSHVTAVKVRPSMTQPTPSSASSSTDPGDRRLAATWAQRRSRREASHGNPVAAWARAGPG